MKKVFLILIILLLIPFAGCQDNPVQQYGDTLVKAKKKSQDVADTAELNNHKKAIEMYRSEKGKMPESIEELEAFSGKSIDRNKFDYKPETGSITLK